MSVRFASWNVNGIRAASKNGLVEFIEKYEFDAIMLQEIKADKKQVPEELHHYGYYVEVFPSRKKGYSGTMCMFKDKAVSVKNGIGDRDFDSEGRVQVLEYDGYFLVNSYFPNSQRGLTRLGYKLQFNDLFLEFCDDLRKEKPVIICGDFNVAHEDRDIARPNDNRKNAGFTEEERTWMTKFLDSGYLDTFRMFSDEGGQYTWWTYRFNARERNIGWRIDYFIVSEELKNKVKGAGILQEVSGSDHAPVFMELES
ncbi:exodeoxyribonuclease III [uncultured archaeon]|nr:exodeoxyribonuclease III [uncultured archaeon]HKJ97240.1 exodeoxyribonuclease III [Thermoplasmataceae archaeon]